MTSQQPLSHLIQQRQLKQLGHIPVAKPALPVRRSKSESTFPIFAFSSPFFLLFPDFRKIFRFQKGARCLLDSPVATPLAHPWETSRWAHQHHCFLWPPPTWREKKRKTGNSIPQAQSWNLSHEDLLQDPTPHHSTSAVMLPPCATFIRSFPIYALPIIHSGLIPNLICAISIPVRCPLLSTG